MALSATDAARAIALVQDGRSQYYAASVLGVSRYSVQRALQRYRETGGFTRRVGSGRKRSTNARDDHFLSFNSLRNRDATAVELRNRLEEVRGTRVSERTVKRRFKEYGLKARRPANGPELTRDHRVARLEFARNDQYWENEEWSNILFTDESRFSLRSPDGRKRIWRRPGERYAQCNIVPKANYAGGSVMVWGGIFMDARTELVLVKGGAMNANRYIRDVLEPHVVPFAPFIGDNFMLMHDNARPHVANIVNEYLNHVQIPRMNWPARSPDLNPIENVWDDIGKRIRTRIPSPAHLGELRAAVLEEWDNTDQGYIQHLIEGMPRRKEAVIQARGGNTRY